MANRATQCSCGPHRALQKSVAGRWANPVPVPEAGRVAGLLTSNGRLRSANPWGRSRSPQSGQSGLVVLGASISDGREGGRVDVEATVKAAGKEAARNVMAGRNAVTPELGGKSGRSSLEERISSGEFGAIGGSKKERITRPVRQLLAKDPIGPGLSPGPSPSPRPSHCHGPSPLKICCHRS